MITKPPKSGGNIVILDKNQRIMRNSESHRALLTVNNEISEIK